MAVADAQIVSAVAWVETLLELKQLPAYSGEHFRDSAQVNLRPRERWSVTHWTVDKQEQTLQQGPGPMKEVTAHLSFIGELGCDEPCTEASLPHMISHPVDFAQFLSVILTCPVETV